MTAKSAYTLLTVIVAVNLSACTGSIGSLPGQGTHSSDPLHSGSSSSTDSTGNSATSACTSQLSLGPAPLRRLSRTEYTNTVRDLFKSPTPAPDGVTDPPALGFQKNAAGLTVTPP